jgi:hypothetical protein
MQQPLPTCGEKSEISTPPSAGFGNPQDARRHIRKSRGRGQMVVRVHKLATLEKRLVERRLGVLAASDWAQVQAKIQQL